MHARCALADLLFSRGGIYVSIHTCSIDIFRAVCYTNMAIINVVANDIESFFFLGLFSVCLLLK